MLREGERGRERGKTSGQGERVGKVNRKGKK